MRARFTWLLMASLMTIALAVPALAQNQQPTPSPSPSPAPSSDGSAAPASSPAPSAPPATEKKIWTNDNLGSKPEAPARAGSAKTQPAKPGAKPAQGKNAAYYRAQINKMNTQIVEINKKIASYQDALSGTAQPGGGVEQYHMHAADWHAEIQKLTQQKQELYTKIDALEDEARRNGIESGDLH